MSVSVSPIRHVFKHAALTNVQSDQHHLPPEGIPIQNTTQSVPPLPGGPGYWQISVPFDTNYAGVSLVSGWQSNDVGGKRGGRWLVTRNQWQDATGMSWGGSTAWRNSCYVGMFSRVAGSLEVSHRIWTLSGLYISLTDAVITQTGPSSRVLQLEFTNYGASSYTLTVYGEIMVMG